MEFLGILVVLFSLEFNKTVQLHGDAGLAVGHIDAFRFGQAVGGTVEWDTSDMSDMVAASWELGTAEGTNEAGM